MHASTFIINWPAAAAATIIAMAITAIVLNRSVKIKFRGVEATVQSILKETVSTGIQVNHAAPDEATLREMVKTLTAQLDATQRRVGEIGDFIALITPVILRLQNDAENQTRRSTDAAPSLKPRARASRKVVPK